MTFNLAYLWGLLARDSWGGVALSAVLAVACAFAVHRVGAALLRRFARGRPVLAPVLRRAHAPSLWLLIFIVLQVVLLSAPDDLRGIAAGRHACRVLVIAFATWLALRACQATGKAIAALHPADIADNLGARRIQTQTQVLVRCVNAAILLLGVAAALLTFPGVREIGASIMASAGIIGLVTGFAARPVLGNLIAGLQIALTQPIRLDDVLIVLGEWGRVEEITGAYVVIRIWDDRRLVVPLQWFVENPFQNWTRRSAQLTGTVFLWLDYRMAVAPLRDELQRLCEQAPEWDRRVCVLQVTDASDRAMQLRALVSSTDSGRNWDLRCKVREGLIAYVRQHCPEGLPRLRAELSGDGGAPAGRQQLSPDR